MPAFCSVDGCDRPHKARGYCATHYQQFKRGEIPTLTIAARQATLGLICLVEGCENPVKSLGYCRMHYARFKRHGNALQGRKRHAICSIDGCDSPVLAKNLCGKHYWRVWRTGVTDEPVVRKDAFETCQASGCKNIVVARGLCQKHYMRWKRHEHVLDTRPADWGAREKSPLYPVWNAIMRYHRGNCCERWHDLWNFVADVEASRPSPIHKLVRKDDSLPYGPNNFYWREPKVTRDDAPGQAAYMRKWYAANTEKVKNTEVRRRYGISFGDYQAMFEAQNGKCAICNQPESRVDHRTKKTSMLAIDHCHKTGRVRELLCRSCNNGIGSLNDDIELVRRALAYLERHASDAPDPIDLILDGAPPSGPPN
jgi:hypothetical protein